MRGGIILAVLFVQRNSCARNLLSRVSSAIYPMLWLSSGIYLKSQVGCELEGNLKNVICDRYRVVFSVSDVTGIAGFVGFDEEVAKLTQVLASEAAQIVVGLIDF